MFSLTLWLKPEIDLCLVWLVFCGLFFPKSFEPSILALLASSASELPPKHPTYIRTRLKVSQNKQGAIKISTPFFLHGSGRSINPASGWVTYTPSWRHLKDPSTALYKKLITRKSRTLWESEKNQKCLLTRSSKSDSSRFCRNCSKGRVPVFSTIQFQHGKTTEKHNTRILNYRRTSLNHAITNILSTPLEL